MKDLLAEWRRGMLRAERKLHAEFCALAAAHPEPLIREGPPPLPEPKPVLVFTEDCGDLRATVHEETRPDKPGFVATLRLRGQVIARGWGETADGALYTATGRLWETADKAQKWGAPWSRWGM